MHQMKAKCFKYTPNGGLTIVVAVLIIIRKMGSWSLEIRSYLPKAQTQLCSDLGPFHKRAPLKPTAGLGNSGGAWHLFLEKEEAADDPQHLAHTHISKAAFPRLCSAEHESHGASECVMQNTGICAQNGGKHWDKVKQDSSLQNFSEPLTLSMTTSLAGACLFPPLHCHRGLHQLSQHPLSPYSQVTPLFCPNLQRLRASLRRRTGVLVAAHRVLRSPWCSLIDSPTSPPAPFPLHTLAQELREATSRALIYLPYLDSPSLRCPLSTPPSCVGQRPLLHRDVLFNMVTSPLLFLAQPVHLTLFTWPCSPDPAHLTLFTFAFSLYLSPSPMLLNTLSYCFQCLFPLPWRLSPSEQGSLPGTVTET